MKIKRRSAGECRKYNRCSRFQRFYTASNLVTSRAFWTLAWTEPRRSAPIFFSSWVSRTKSQSCRSSLCSTMKSTSVSRNMLKTWYRERGMMGRRGEASERWSRNVSEGRRRDKQGNKTKNRTVRCGKVSSRVDQKVSKHLLSGVC